MNIQEECLVIGQP